jgi:hypothetical protein
VNVGKTQQKFSTARDATSGALSASGRGLAASGAYRAGGEGRRNPARSPASGSQCGSSGAWLRYPTEPLLFIVAGSRFYDRIHRSDFAAEIGRHAVMSNRRSRQNPHTPPAGRSAARPQRRSCRQACWRWGEARLTCSALVQCCIICMFITSDDGIRLSFRFVMITSEPPTTRSTTRMPKASASTLLVLSGAVVICRKNTR